MTRIESTIRELEAIGFKVLLPSEADQLRTTGKMLSVYGEDCFPPPNEQGQRHFGDLMMESAAKMIVSIFYPLRDLCAHAWDEQAGCCRTCGAHREDYIDAPADVGDRTTPATAAASPETKLTEPAHDG